MSADTIEEKVAILYNLTPEEQKTLHLRGYIDLDQGDWNDISQTPPENKTIFNVGASVTIQFDVTRYGDVTRKLDIQPDSTWGQVYQQIYDYLNRYELTEADLEELRDGECEYDAGSYLGSDSDKYHWIDFIGGACYFEGFRIKRDADQISVVMLTGS